MINTLESKLLELECAQEDAKLCESVLCVGFAEAIHEGVEEANDSLIQKAIDGLNKFKDAVVKWVKDMVAKLRTKFSKDAKAVYTQHKSRWDANKGKKISIPGYPVEFEGTGTPVAGAMFDTRMAWVKKALGVAKVACAKENVLDFKKELNDGTYKKNVYSKLGTEGKVTKASSSTEELNSAIAAKVEKMMQNSEDKIKEIEKALDEFTKTINEAVSGFKNINKESECVHCYVKATNIIRDALKSSLSFQMNQTVMELNWAKKVFIKVAFAKDGKEDEKKTTVKEAAEFIYDEPIFE